MQSIGGVTQVSPASESSSVNSMAALGSEDFFRLLITQLTNQDPLEPTGNEELLRQISSIREIELSTALTRSLEQLSGQQRISSASGLIGQFVTALGNDGASVVQGMVRGVRFDAAGQTLLQLADGTELPLERVQTIAPPLVVAEALRGQTVVGVDGRSGGSGEVVEGVVSGVRIDERGDVVLELDTGEALRLQDVVEVRSSIV